MKKYSEVQFRRFEPLIREILVAWPAPYVFSLPPDPDGPGAESTANQLREAVRGLVNNNWKTDLDYPKFLDFASAYRVSIAEGKLTIAPRDYAAAAGRAASPKTTQFDLILDNLPDEVVIAAAILLHYKCFAVARVRTRSADLLAKVASIYKISVAPDVVGRAEGWHIMCR